MLKTKHPNGNKAGLHLIARVLQMEIKKTSNGTLLKDMEKSRDSHCHRTIHLNTKPLKRMFY